MSDYHTRFTAYYNWFKSTESPIAPKGGDSNGHIQWKGTEVCMDIQCSCGHREHIDAEFVYNVECTGCGRVFAVQQHIHLLEVPDEHREHAKGSCCVKF